MSSKWVTGDDGLLREINEKGEVLQVQKTRERSDKKRYVATSPGSQKILRRSMPPGPRSKAAQDTHHFVKDGDGRKIWVPKGTDPGCLPRKVYPYNPVTCDHILSLITEGKTVNAIGKMEDMPTAPVIHKWMREYPEFREQMALAKKARAEWRSDQVMEIADNEEIHPDDVPKERLRSDLYKYGAEMDDRETYGKQTKVTGTSGTPLVLIVNTGVPAPQVLDVPNVVEIPSSSLPADPEPPGAA